MTKFLTVEEAAELLTLSPWTLRHYICERRIPYVKVGKRTLFDPIELQGWIDSQRVPVGERCHE